MFEANIGNVEELHSKYEISIKIKCLRKKTNIFVSLQYRDNKPDSEKNTKLNQ